MAVNETSPVASRFSLVGRNAIVMLSAQRTAAINGVTLYVDGGMSRK